MTQDYLRQTIKYAIAYFAGILLVTMIDLLLIRVPNMIHTPSMAALVGVGAYFGLMKRVPHFGAITSLGAMMSVFFLLSGHFVWAALPNVICALIADFLAHRKSYKLNTLTRFSYVIFSLGNIAPIATMWLAPDAYAAQLLSRGKDQTYIDRVMIPANLESIGGQFVGIILSAILGILLYECYQSWRKKEK